MAAAYQGKILARSPFYITATGSATINSASLQVFIWAGAFASQPGTPYKTISKNALTATDTNIIFEISQLVRDFFDHNRDAYDDALSTFSDCIFVETILSVDQTDANDPDVNNYYHAFDGYGYFADSVNPDPTNVMVNTINVETGEDILHAAYCHSDGVADEVKYYSQAGALQETVDLSAAVASTNAYDKIQYLTRASGEDTFSFKYFLVSVEQEEVFINYIEECKFTPNVVKFYDANGTLQILYMFKRSIESLRTNRDSYNKIIGSISANEYVYSTEKHQKQSFNITAEKSIILNSGYVLEAQNTVFEQLLESELVWVDDKPVNVTTSSFQIKTQLDDKLIDYTIGFDYAYSEINNVY